MATGEDWYKIMFDTTRSREYGCSDDFRSCGNGNIYIDQILEKPSLFFIPLLFNI